MAEVGSELPQEQAVYLSFAKQITENPFEDDLLPALVELAQTEDNSGMRRNYYDNVPLAELVSVAQKLQEAKTSEERYRLLSERSSIGASWYDVILGRTNSKLMSGIEELVKVRRWGRALDVGTGTGESMKALERQVNKVVGVDQLAFLLGLAKEKKEETTDLVAAQAELLPFAKESFDLVSSNGLTFYLDDGQLKAFGRQVARVLKPAGVYVEAFPAPFEGKVVPDFEKELVTSAKGLLVLLMDRRLTQPYRQEVDWFDQWKKAFTNAGLGVIDIHRMDEKGIVVVEFRKPFSRDFRLVLSLYSSGDQWGAQEGMFSYLYDKADLDVETRKQMPLDKLPPTEEIKERLGQLERFVFSEDVLKATSVHRDFYIAFIVPLLSGASQKGDEYAGIRSLFNKSLEPIVRLFIERHIDFDSKHWSHKQDRKMLEEIGDDLSGILEARGIVSLIDRTLTS
ncbi:hypothetical protein A3A66_00080 [Microgenomates group bacterium RIFCSPLOWO2_01_FULL_46_13]|nr:MAG: hypothetical protein A2783_01300 [Microgenomates group bacterium RIFCSPHIGHO2_01_FULL_45_11]OGV94417.1 MAG: hypothetical protein A3A66_00080 [Microgenomates group bacterium RIFCSPLOWO2_01_FULL_46_13]